MRMKRRVVSCVAVLATVVLVFVTILLCFRAAYRRPYRSAVEKSGMPPELVYAIIKAESGFREDAVSSAGAVGLMQLRPSTAQFVCERAGIEFDAERLKEGEYNIDLGCRYLSYLFERFALEAALAAYNAGEGTVREWLADSQYSSDGVTLARIPYSETAAYLKKVLHFKKMYKILYR